MTTYALGHVVPLAVEIVDANGSPAAPGAITLTITRNGVDTPVTPTNTGLGQYTATYTPPAAGHYTARWVATGVNAGAFEVFWRVTGLPVAPITLADVKTYLGTTSASDATITAALTAETEAQADVVQPKHIANPAVREALLRRVARNLAMRGQPLAVFQSEVDGSSSTVVLPGRDPEVRRLEAPFRRLVVG